MEYNHTCELCKKAFTSYDRFTRFCSDACRSLHRRALPAKAKSTVKCEFCHENLQVNSRGLALHKCYCNANPNRRVGSQKGRPRTPEEKAKISATMKLNKLAGGYRQGSGRGKKGSYKGYYCDSSWELAYVVFNLDNNISFTRNEELFPYEFKGEQHKYKPDFIEAGVYVEIKGYFTEQTAAKEAAFPRPLKYLGAVEIKPYIAYAIAHYGKEYWKVLYDK